VYGGGERSVVGSREAILAAVTAVAVVWVMSGVVVV
jgi:hypothetical protein